MTSELWPETRPHLVDLKSLEAVNARSRQPATGWVHYYGRKKKKKKADTSLRLQQLHSLTAPCGNKVVLGMFSDHFSLKLSFPKCWYLNRVLCATRGSGGGLGFFTPQDLTLPGISGCHSLSSRDVARLQPYGCFLMQMRPCPGPGCLSKGNLTLPWVFLKQQEETLQSTGDRISFRE